MASIDKIFVSTGASYVVAAYGIILFALVLYVVVIGLRASRAARESELLAQLVERSSAEGPDRAAEEAGVPVGDAART